MLQETPIDGQVLEAEEVPIPKEVTKFRTDLRKADAGFLQVLDATLTQHERIASQGLVGFQTFELTAKSLLKQGLKTDEDYQTAVALANQAGAREKQTSDRFDSVGAVGFMFKFHRALTGLRNAANEPWGNLREKLSKAAAAWYLEQKRAKERAEQELAESARRQQNSLIQQAEDLMVEGRVQEAREALAEARATVTPILPDAVPKVEGARIKERFVGACKDLLATALAIVLTEQKFCCPHCGKHIQPQVQVPLMHKEFAADGTEKWERPLLVVDQVVLNAVVGRMGRGMDWPGIEITEEVKIGAKKL